MRGGSFGRTGSQTWWRSIAPVLLLCIWGSLFQSLLTSYQLRGWSCVPFSTAQQERRKAGTICPTTGTRKGTAFVIILHLAFAGPAANEIDLLCRLLHDMDHGGAIAC